MAGICDALDLRKSLVGFPLGHFVVGDTRERALAMDDASFAGWTPPEKSIKVIEGQRQQGQISNFDN